MKWVLIIGVVLFVNSYKVISDISTVNALSNFNVPPLSIERFSDIQGITASSHESDIEDQVNEFEERKFVSIYINTPLEKYNNNFDTIS